MVVAPRVIGQDLPACRIDGIDEELRCGAIVVPEDRSGPPRVGPDLATIRLRVVVLPATGPTPANDPVFILQGGPGQAATALTAFYAGDSWAATRRDRAIVLIDQRGTGDSRPLDCTFGSDLNPQGYLDALFPIPAVRACLVELRERGDLRRYTTIDAIHDLEAVRIALKAGRLNLYGTSYGTRVAQAYWRAYPQRVRSIVLKGVVPPEMVIPETFASDADRSLRLLARDCRADSVCVRLVPDLAAAVDTLLTRADSAPLRAAITVDSLSGRRAGLTLRRGPIAATIRSLLQSPATARQIPGVVRRALDGDAVPLARITVDVQRSAAQSVFTGMQLSVICAEDAPRHDASRARSLASNTFLGTYWFDQVAAACREWPMPAVDRSLLTPPEDSPIPVLLISGETDPATPPHAAESLRRRVRGARHVIVSNASHSFGLMRGCVDVLIAEFYRRADPSSLDASCALAVSPAPFPAAR